MRLPSSIVFPWSKAIHKPSSEIIQRIQSRIRSKLDLIRLPQFQPQSPKLRFEVLHIGLAALDSFGGSDSKISLVKSLHWICYVFFEEAYIWTI